MSTLSVDNLRLAIKGLEERSGWPITIQPTSIIVGPRIYKLSQRRLKRQRLRDRHLQRDPHIGLIW